MDYRPWHLRTCAARDAVTVADDDVDGACGCPAGRFIAKGARPVWEPGDRHWWQRAAKRLRAAL